MRLVFVFKNATNNKTRKGTTRRSRHDQRSNTSGTVLRNRIPVKNGDKQDERGEGVASAGRGTRWFGAVQRTRSASGRRFKTHAHLRAERPRPTGQPLRPVREPAASARRRASSELAHDAVHLGGVLLQPLPLEGRAQGTHLVLVVFLLLGELQEHLRNRKTRRGDIVKEENNYAVGLLHHYWNWLVVIATAKWLEFGVPEGTHQAAQHSATGMN